MEGFKRQVGIDVSVMKYILATGMSIRYQNANIVQHKLKDINSKRIRSAEERAKLSNSLKGHYVSENTKKKIASKIPLSL